MPNQSTSKPKRKLLISGACGGLACELSKILCDHYDIVGIDPRSERSDKKFLGEFHRSHYRSRKVDEIFRKDNFDAFLHLGRVPVTSKVDRNDRYSENVLGTKHLLDLCAKHSTPNVIVMSTYHVYGAHPHNPLYLSEEDPLRATQRIPELSDAMELDHLATSFALSHPGEVVVLRPANVVGKKISNAVSELLRLPWLPVPLGFDPPLQLIHQDDVIQAVIKVLKKPKRGTYNLAGPGSIPLSALLGIKNIKAVPIPDLFIKGILNKIPKSTFNVPSYMVDYFKFPTLMDNRKFIESYKFGYKYNLIDCLENI